ncbi:hypothetical protein FS749_003371 [Ceratobasidium sp. UAMH 11750]|nr:hypothetical protein FS749_003371 [Ceratobasidium sp. UAMH 11750]
MRQPASSGPVELTDISLGEPVLAIYIVIQSAKLAVGLGSRDVIFVRDDGLRAFRADEWLHRRPHHHPWFRLFGVADSECALHLFAFPARKTPSLNFPMCSLSRISPLALAGSTSHLQR